MAQTTNKFHQFRAPKKSKKTPKVDPQREHEEWLKSINSMTLFKHPKPMKKSSLPSKMPSLSARLGEKVNSVISSAPAGGTKKVPRPEIVYRDDPEMLARELKARERKFAIAPAYNKGAAQLVTDEFMKDITAGTTRRR